MLFGVPLKAVIIVVLLAVAASFSTFYFNYVSAPVNFELVKLGTILASSVYGFLPGLAVGIASTFFGKVLIGRIDEKLPISMAAISAVALAATVFSNVDITQLGIALALAYNAAMFTLSILMGGGLAWNLPYEVTGFIFNALLFANVAPLLKQLM